MSKFYSKLFFLLIFIHSMNGFSQVILWENGFQTPSQWTQINGPNHTAGDWLFLTTLPTFDPIYQLQLQGLPPTFSAANGNFAFISYDTGLNSSADSQDAYLQYNNFIDLASAGSFPLEFSFNDFYKTYNGQELSFEISNNGGSTWTQYEVNSNLAINTNCIDGEIESFIIFPSGGTWTNQVLIKFHYVGNFSWFWGIDNVKIKTVPNYDLVLNNIQWGSIGSLGIKTPYYKIPYSQLAPIEFSGVISNYGIQNQNDIVFNVNTPSFSINSSASSINSGETDTLLCQYTPTSIGTFNLSANVNSTITDAYPGNNTINNFASIEVTDVIYSLDNGIINANFAGYNSQYNQVGNAFDIFNDAILNSIDIVPSSGINQELVVQLYSWDPNISDWVYLNESNVYSLNPSDIGNVVSLPLVTPQNLNAGERYLAAIYLTGNARIAGSVTNPPWQTSYFLDNNSQWNSLYLDLYTPMIRMRLCNMYDASSSTTVTACDNYLSPAGNIYTSSGVYTDVIPVGNGCGDSTITTTLTIINSVQTNFSETICGGDTYTWNNQDYTTSGMFTQTFQAVNGCDSIVTLDLTVNTNNTIQIQANPTFGNSPLNVAFNNQTSDLSDYNFTWYFGDGSTQQSNSSFLSHVYTQDAYSDVTLVAVNNTTGCVSSSVFNDMIFVIGGVICTHSATINQTGPLSACLGDSIFLSCNTDQSFSYQWNRNGVPISGATSSSIFAMQSGSYTVSIYQNNCPVISSGISITINSLPEIPTITSTGNITSCSGGALTLTAPIGFNSYEWNTGETTASIQVTQSGNYFVSVTNLNGCERNSNLVSVNASFMSSPSICIVGMDSLTNQNRIVWEKPLTAGIDSFYVYKETNVSNVYSKIGATDYNDLAVFLDQNSNPAVQAYRYKLAILDTCGTETNLGDFHKTIHLTINAGVGGAWNLIWSQYEGLTFGSYNIYRGSDPTNISLLTTIQSNLNSYTDLTPPTGPIYYQIEIINPNSCNPLKVINYNDSKSNIVFNGMNDLNDFNKNNIHIYPNPTSNHVTVEVTADLLGQHFNLTDQFGRVILSGRYKSLKEEINLEQIASGMYFLKNGNNSNVSFKIVKN
jgi:hypothetical protein